MAAMPKLADAAEREIADIALEDWEVETFEYRRARSKGYFGISVWDLPRALLALCSRHGRALSTAVSHYGGRAVGLVSNGVARLRESANSTRVGLC